MIKRLSRAKLNWFLHVGQPRSDGYHELHTLFQELDFAEQITFTLIPDQRCVLHGFDSQVAVETNLIYRAWHLMKNEFPQQVSGLDVHVDKVLPMGGGLGGGSSNAAVTLVALNELYALDIPAVQLRELGATIGSDVPFFIEGGLALATGRGERIQSLSPSPRYWLCLYVPASPMSTAEGYRLLDEMPRVPPSAGAVEKFISALYSGSPVEVADAFLPNDFELVAQGFDWFMTAAQKLDAAGALKVFLCGSGSTVAALARDEHHAREMATQTGGICTSTATR